MKIWKFILTAMAVGSLVFFAGGEIPTQTDSTVALARGGGMGTGGSMGTGGGGRTGGSMGSGRSGESKRPEASKGVGSEMGPGLMSDAGLQRYMNAVHAGLTEQKRTQLRKDFQAMTRDMTRLRTRLQTHTQEMDKAMQGYPMNQDAAKKAHQAIQETQREMFEARLRMMKRMQELAGEKGWESAAGKASTG